MGLSLLQILVHIQTHLDADLSLESLASSAGLSPSHFHRAFRSRIGETPKQYTQRLRLERAALRLCLHETSVLDTALEVGFHSHETFTRAFGKRFGVAPRELLRHGMAALDRGAPPNRTDRKNGGEASYELSASALVTLKPLDLAFIRHVGPYEDVGNDIFEELTHWADRKALGSPRVLMGIGHDAPGLTPPDKLRFDAALRVDRPFRSSGAVAYQQLAGGRHAVATHVGHYSTLNRAYPRLMERITRMKGVRPAGLPAIEMYHETKINVDFSLNHTDIYLPVITQGSIAPGTPSH